MTNVRFNHKGRLLIGSVDSPDECVLADETDGKTGDTVTLVCEKSWGGGGGYMGGVCWIGSSRGGGGSSDYRVLKSKVELERYDTLAQASKSAYKAQFKELAKIAEAKHKERKTLRKFRLFQVRALKANAQTLPDGRTWFQILSEAESGDVPAMLKLAESYATGVPDGKIPKRPKESLAWYLRAAVCGSVEAMKIAASDLEIEANGNADHALAMYWKDQVISCRSRIC